MHIVEAFGIESAPAARGHVVVIDVLRAFTCAAFAFDAGADSIVLVSTTDEAFAVRRARPDVLLMGEVGGRLIPGFDFSNSPNELVRAKERLRGKTLVQRTGCGTQGVTSARDADAIYLGSLPVASATCRHLQRIGAETVTLLAMGSPSGSDGPEDVACRTYMADVLRGRAPDRDAAIREVRESKGGRWALDPAVDWISPQDLMWATAVDYVSFAMPVQREGELLVARRVDQGDAPRLDERLPFDVQVVLAGWRRGNRGHPDDLARSAERLVDLGFEHPALFDLVGLTRVDATAAGDLLDRAIVDLGLSLEEPRARLVLCVDAARRIVAGTVRPEVAAGFICSESEYGYAFRGADRDDWCLFEPVCNTEYCAGPGTTEHWRAVLVEHARRVVRKYGPPSLEP